VTGQVGWQCDGQVTGSGVLQGAIKVPHPESGVATDFTSVGATREQAPQPLTRAAISVQYDRKMPWKSRLLFPERSIPEAFGLADGNGQFFAHLPQRDLGSKDFERPGLAPPAQIASALAEQFPARVEHHLDIDFVPNGKLTRAQRFQIFETLLPKIGKVIEIVEAQTMSYSFECCSPGRQIEQHAVANCPVGFPEVYERLSCDQARKTTPVASQTGLRRTEKQIEAVFGVAYLAHIPKNAFDISNLAEDAGLAFHPCFQFRKSDTRLGMTLNSGEPEGWPGATHSQRSAAIGSILAARRAGK